LPAARGAPRDPRPHRPRPHRQPRSGRTLDRARPGGPAASELTAAPQRGGFRQGEVGSGPVAVAVEVGAARRAGAVTVTVTVVDGGPGTVTVTTGSGRSSVVMGGVPGSPRAR